MAKMKNALPKRMAGMKIPKVLRRNRTLVRLARHPKLVELAAAGLVAAVSAVALKDRAVLKRATKPAKSKSREVASKLSPDAAMVADSLKGKSRRATVRPARVTVPL